jgi:hypothetical protein
VTVLDASAVLTLVHGEPGAEQVAAELPSATLGTVDLAEVIGKLGDVDVDVSNVRQLLAAAGVTIEPLLEQDAELAGALRSIPGAGHCPWETGAASLWPCAVLRPRFSPLTVRGLSWICRSASGCSGSTASRTLQCF